MAFIISRKVNLLACLLLRWLWTTSNEISLSHQRKLLGQFLGDYIQSLWKLLVISGVSWCLTFNLHLWVTKFFPTIPNFTFLCNLITFLIKKPKLYLRGFKWKNNFTTPEKIEIRQGLQTLFKKLKHPWTSNSISTVIMGQVHNHLKHPQQLWIYKHMF